MQDQHLLDSDLNTFVLSMGEKINSANQRCVQNTTAEVEIC